MNNLNNLYNNNHIEGLINTNITNQYPKAKKMRDSFVHMYVITLHTLPFPYRGRKKLQTEGTGVERKRMCCYQNREVLRESLQGKKR